MEARPASTEPVGFVRLVILAGLELFIKEFDEIVRCLLDIVVVDDAFGLQSLSIYGADPGMLANAIDQGLALPANLPDDA